MLSDLTLSEPLQYELGLNHIGLARHNVTLLTRFPILPKFASGFTVACVGYFSELEFLMRDSRVETTN